ncbi:MAG: peptidase S41, partial [Sinomicrobium sp.]|nr:peptidase S41 [Sinomicrobium sp.]
KVYDGGGIVPDIEITPFKYNDFTRALSEQQIIFDYATQYHYNHTVNSVNGFSFTDNDYEDFKRFVAKNDLAYNTSIEKTLRSVEKDTDFEALSNTIKQDYETLLRSIRREKTTILYAYKNKIIKDGKDEIIKRYFYREGLYDYNITHDEAIITSVNVLADNQKYNSILKH